MNDKERRFNFNNSNDLYYKFASEIPRHHYTGKIASKILLVLFLKKFTENDKHLLHDEI